MQNLVLEVNLEVNLLVSKFTPGFDQMQKYLSFTHVRILKILVMRTQTKFT